MQPSPQMQEVIRDTLKKLEEDGQPLRRTSQRHSFELTCQLQYLEGGSISEFLKEVTLHSPVVCNPRTGWQERQQNQKDSWLPSFCASQVMKQLLSEWDFCRQHGCALRAFGMIADFAACQSYEVEKLKALLGEAWESRAVANHC